MANETEAPTNAETLANAEAVEKTLNEFQLDFVTFMHQWWLTEGELLTAPVALERYGYPLDDFVKHINTPAVLQVLKKRGVEVVHLRRKQNVLAAVDPASPEIMDWRATTLKPHQLVVANAMLDLNDTRSDKKKLQDQGIGTAKWQSWLRDENFRAYLQKRAESLLGDSQHEAALALLDRVRSGDIRAIEYYHEYTGKYTRKASNGGQNALQADQQNTDLKLFVVKLLEIITEEVSDHQAAARISDRIKQTLYNQSIVNAVTSDKPDEIVMPTIAPNRELPAHMMKLVEKNVVD